VSQRGRLSHLLWILGIMQVAMAAAIRAAETGHWHEPLSHSFRDTTLQILGGNSNEYLQKAGEG